MLAAATVGVLAVRQRMPARAHYAFDADAVPLEVAGFAGGPGKDVSAAAQYLQAQAALSREYQRGDEPAVQLTVIYGTDWRTVHAPTGCYPAQGWQVVREEPADLPAGGGPAEPLHAHFLYATKSGHGECALFLYAHPGGTTADWARQGWVVATGRPGAGGLVLIATTKVGPQSDEQTIVGARTRLADLVTAVYGPVVGFWGTANGSYPPTPLPRREGGYGASPPAPLPAGEGKTAGEGGGGS